MNELYLLYASTALFLAAWAVQTRTVLKRGINTGDVFVNLFFLTGNIVLSVYLYQTNDIAFAALNTMFIALTLINFIYIPAKIKHAKKDILLAEKTLKKEATTLQNKLIKTEKEIMKRSAFKKKVK